VRYRAALYTAPDIPKEEYPKGEEMDLSLLNPAVHSVLTYEKITRKEESVSYNARLFYVVSGDVVITVEGKSLGHIGGGGLVYIPAGVPYKLRGQYFMMIAAAFDLFAGGERVGSSAPSEFDNDALPARDTAPFDKVIKLSEMESERDELLRMCATFIAGDGEYRAELSARMKLILLRVAEAANPAALPSRMSTALGEYIRENISDEISNTEVAATFGYHPFYISNVLKAAKGQTLRQYIISYRLALARAMLRTTAKSVAEIAEECGFTDASYFTKTHRQVFGETPKDYRNRFKDEFI
jgi:AraC-like DNA-binding protein